MYYDEFESFDTDLNKKFTFVVTGNTNTNEYFVKVYDDTDTCIDSSSFSRLPINEDIILTFGLGC